MSEAKYDKIGRILSIYTKLINGYTIGKAKEAQKYGVNERSIQRDIEDIRAYLANDSSNSGCINTIIYDRFHKGYMGPVYLTAKCWQSVKFCWTAERLQKLK